MAHDREVAGIRCGRVLELLSDYQDGELSPEDVTRVEGHLRGCDWCERFGRDFSTAVGRLRRQLGVPSNLDQDMARRLRKRLDEEP